jgi:gluconolactonase
LAEPDGRIQQLVDGLDHPEGVAYDPEAGVVWAGGEAGQIYRIELADSSWAEVARAPGLVLGVAVDGLGRVAVFAPGSRAMHVLEDGALSTVLDAVEGEPLHTPNHGAFGPDGTLYFSDSGHWAENDGRLIALSPDGAANVMSTALDHFPNGCAVSPDGAWLWTVESFRPTINRFDLVGGGPPEVVMRLEGTVPDGLAFTADGGLLISLYRPDRILYLDGAGQLSIVADDPQGTLLAAPTNICFVGADLDRVVAANFNRWHLSLLDLGLRGVPLHRPRRWGFDAR